jgi:putative ABC transport system ATP-binding protein
VSAPASFELRDVVAGPDQAPILRGVSLNIACSGVTAIAGPSGAGKSTLLRLLDRLDDPRSGVVRLDGRDLTAWEPGALRRRVAMVFQRPPLFEGTVLDNLRVAVSSLDRDGGVRALQRVGLPEVLIDRAAADLSGGEAQRMCIARALLTEPAVLLADEPTSSLDGAATAKIEALMVEIAAGGVPVVLVTHDVPQLRRIADRALVIVDGGVAAHGSLDELDAHPDPLVRELVGAR